MTEIVNKTENEVWKTYPEYPFIQGSSLGRVRTVDRYVTCKDGRKRFLKGQVLVQHDNGHGYVRVVFRANGKVVHRQVHRIIASCFLSNPDNLPEVNHKDCNPKNNCVNNLEWVTRQENIAYRDKLGHTARHNKPMKPVIAVNLKTLTVLYFESQNEAARKLWVNQGNINGVLIGKRNKCNGYWFTNADNNAVKATRAKFDDIVAHKVEQLVNEKELQLA